MTTEQTLQPAETGLLPKAAVITLTAAIRRALDAVTLETEALRSGNQADLRTFEHRKSQALLDLARARASIPPLLHDEEIAGLLRQLKSALSANMALLEHHMKAVQEITELLARSMLEADSDGTYSRRLGGASHD